MNTASYLDRLLFLLSPGLCVICKARTSRTLDLCEGCEADLPCIDNPCPGCGLSFVPSSATTLESGNHSDTYPDKSSDQSSNKCSNKCSGVTVTRCGSCLVNHPDFDAILCAYAYAEPVGYLINGFKNRGRMSAGKVLADRLYRFSLNHADFFSQTDLVIPMPLHKNRLRQRGFNQACLLAKPLARHFSLPVDKTMVQRVKATDDQKSLDAADRALNISQAFVVHESLDNQHLLIVDDVVTTGASVAELSRTLKRAGAASVKVLSLARTPRRS